jgi:hypothetical protein
VRRPKGILNANSCAYCRILEFVEKPIVIERQITAGTELVVLFS